MPFLIWLNEAIDSSEVYVIAGYLVAQIKEELMTMHEHINQSVLFFC